MNWHWNSEYVRIYNQEIYTAAEERPIVHVFEQMLDAGTYYIKVLPYGNNTGRYTLLSEKKIVTKSIKKYQFFMDVFNILKSKYTSLEIERVE